MRRVGTYELFYLWQSMEDVVVIKESKKKKSTQNLTILKSQV